MEIKKIFVIREFLSLTYLLQYKIGLCISSSSCHGMKSNRLFSKLQNIGPIGFLDPQYLVVVSYTGDH